jgi:uncharacterized membrane-anchored protein YhcB (DUF1043 family)
MIVEWIKHVLTIAFLFSLILSTIALGVQKIGLLRWEGYSFYLLLVLISFAFSLLYTLRTKKSFMDELIEIDVRLGLKERLSTAFECHQLGRQSVFVDMLMKDASSLLESIKAKKIFPRNVSPSHLLIPLFAGVIIILLLVDFTPTVPIRDRATEQEFKQISSKMEEYSKRELQDMEKTGRKSQKDLFREMKNIAEEVKGQSMTKERLLKSLGALMEEAEAEQSQLARALQAELSLGDTSRTPMLKPLQKEKVTPNELKKLTEQLKELFGGEVPASISQALSSLDQNRRLELFLDKTINEVRSAFEDEGESYLVEGEKDVYAGKTFEKRSNDNKDTSPGRSLAALESNLENAKRQISPDLGGAQAGSKKSDKRGQAPDEDLSYTAGRGKAEGRKKPPSELVGSKSPALKDEGISGQGEWYNVYVRSLPTMGKAKLKEEDIIRLYRQELEGVLQKEDIPPHYREYIRNYFLSIGLKREENGNGYSN